MDAASVIRRCESLSSTIDTTSASLARFVREVREARKELDLLSRELHSLKTILELLGDDFSRLASDAILPTLPDRTEGILRNCHGSVEDVIKLLEAHRSSSLGLAKYWAEGGGQDTMIKLIPNIETHKAALELVLDLFNFSTSQDQKKSATHTSDYRASL